MPPADPRTAPLPLHYMGHLLRRAQQLHQAAWNAQVSTATTSVQFAALSVLANRPGASQADLGAELDLDRSTIADLVRRMLGRGLITRTGDPVDGRRKILTLTPEGDEVLRDLQPRVEALEPVLTGGLDRTEAAELRRLLMTVLDDASVRGLLQYGRR